MDITMAGCLWTYRSLAVPLSSVASSESAPARPCGSYRPQTPRRPRDVNLAGRTQPCLSARVSDGSSGCSAGITSILSKAFRHPKTTAKIARGLTLSSPMCPCCTVPSGRRSQESATAVRSIVVSFVVSCGSIGCLSSFGTGSGPSAPPPKVGEVAPQEGGGIFGLCAGGCVHRAFGLRSVPDHFSSAASRTGKAAVPLAGYSR